MKKKKNNSGGWKKTFVEVLRGLFFAGYVFLLILTLYGSSSFFTPAPFSVSEARP